MDATATLDSLQAPGIDQEPDQVKLRWAVSGRESCESQLLYFLLRVHVEQYFFLFGGQLVVMQSLSILQCNFDQVF
jgi:hypothetical protein